MLIFVIHPWFSQGALHQNFSHYTDTFCAEFARLSFHSFAGDTTIREGLPTNVLVTLLSAIAFVNVWPKAASQGAGPNTRIYLNKSASNPVNISDFTSLGILQSQQIHLEQI